MQNLELRHLRYFLIVAEERHFGRAARRLGIAQPPLSRQIQALEQALGTSLFDRSQRVVELTTPGRILRDHARRLLESAAVAIAETQRAARGESGRLTIGYPSSVAYSGITDLLRAYREHYPAVEIALREGPPQQQIDNLKARRIDVGFVRGPLVDPALHSERVLEESLLIAMPSDHRLRGTRPLPLARIADEGFIMFPRERGPQFYDRLIGMCREAGFSPRIVQEAPGLDIVSLVAVGLGISIVPDSWRALGRSGIVFRPIEGNPRSELLLAWPKDAVSPVAQEFIALTRRVGMQRRKRR